MIDTDNEYYASVSRTKLRRLISAYAKTVTCIGSCALYKNGCDIELAEGDYGTSNRMCARMLKEFLGYKSFKK